MVLAMMSACNNNHKTGPVSSHIDSVLFEEGRLKHYMHMVELADSFEQSGHLTKLNANRWRGVAYYHQGQYRMAEVCYKKALECEVKTDQDQLCYNKVARRLSELLLVKGDYEGALRVAIPAIAQMDKTGIGSDIDYAILLNNIGCCQLNLGQDTEAQKSFNSARDHYTKRWQTDVTSRGYQEAVLGTVYTSMAYINTRRYAESIYWIDRTEMLLDKYRQQDDARVEYFDEYQGRIYIMRAVALQGLKQPKEAAKAYQESAAYQAFLKTDYSKTGAGRINANDYLIAAHRYNDAADNYRNLDNLLNQTGIELSLDNIQLYLLPKFRANLEAGRRDSAYNIAANILGLLDSAIIAQKNSSTAELATIYDTQGKEAEIARHQADLTHQRFVSTGIAMVLIIIFFGIYYLAKIIGYACGIANSYFWNSRWTFREERRRDAREIVTFVAVNLVTLGLSLLLQWIFRDRLHLDTWWMGFAGENILTKLLNGERFCLLLSSGIALLVNFVGNKLFVFHRTGSETTEE